VAYFKTLPVESQEWYLEKKKLLDILDVISDDPIFANKEYIDDFKKWPDTNFVYYLVDTPAGHYNYTRESMKTVFTENRRRLAL